jgi:hypothetical protein
MDKSTISFLKAVLGNDGMQAMRRAVDRDPRLEYYLVPRTLLGWAMSKSQYEGTIPGVDIYVNFKKSESGYGGKLGIPGTPVTSFTAQDEYALVANLAASMGFEGGVFAGTDKMLVSLGKSVDALLKARAATRALEKGGVDLPGATAKPQQPKGPEEAEAPIKQPKMAAKPKLPKLPVLKVEIKEMSKACKNCGGTLFKSQKFIGCMCWRDLAKHATTTIYSDGAVLEFGRGADKNAVQALYKDLTRG